MTNISIILSIPKGPTRWDRNLKGLSHERGCAISAENLGASPFNRDLTNNACIAGKIKTWTYSSSPVTK
jgi:hypothetical protein